MNTTVSQSQIGFNPYFFNGKQIQNIYFYDNTGIVAKCRWFNDGGSNNDFKEFDLPTENIKRKNKVDYSKDVFFYIKNDERHSEGINLHIPINTIPHKFLGKQLNFETKTEKNFYDVLEIELSSVKRCHRLNDLQKIEYYYDEKKLNTITIKYKYSTELKPYGDKLKDLQEKIQNALKVDHFSKYDIERLIDAKILSV